MNLNKINGDVMDWKDKNILITGADGFVGSYLAEELIKNGANVYGLIQRGTQGIYSQNLVNHGIEDDLKIVEGDLTDITSLAGALDLSEPEYVFHLAAQSFIPASFKDPLKTQMINANGTSNLLEAIRIKDLDPKVVFAGSSDEYGLVISSEEQYETLKSKYGVVFPEPISIPELPIKESNPLRPMSPYATSKVYCEYLMRNYHDSFGLCTVVSRAFNHEGAGRGPMFVTSVVTQQVSDLKAGKVDSIRIGNVNALKDWSHVKDVVNGYIQLAANGVSGDVYNQGAMRTNSVLSYILLSLETAGYSIEKIETVTGEKVMKDPAVTNNDPVFGVKFVKTAVDSAILEEGLEYTAQDGGINVFTDKGKVAIEFDLERFRPSEVPISLCDNTKIRSIGANYSYTVKDIIGDQLDYLNPK
ncbi:GDP-mannose 4,6-dehydratase [Methanobacterium lacus]|uniref:GDP-mannose 4,6-dehydratase n=2 Tax=Methanobacterium lacus (strain AL-21) TaxID=877455 RepID=F0TBL2_METLA|nr:GDP-mannose 4,6-dehydratase [Methanobacterium lacus]